MPCWAIMVFDVIGHVGDSIEGLGAFYGEIDFFEWEEGVFFAVDNAEVAWRNEGSDVPDFTKAQDAG